MECDQVQLVFSQKKIETARINPSLLSSKNKIFLKADGLRGKSHWYSWHLRQFTSIGITNRPLASLYWIAPLLVREIWQHSGTAREWFHSREQRLPCECAAAYVSHHFEENDVTSVWEVSVLLQPYKTARRVKQDATWQEHLLSFKRHGSTGLVGVLSQLRDAEIAGGKADWCASWSVQCEEICSYAPILSACRSCPPPNTYFLKPNISVCIVIKVGVSRICFNLWPA